MSCYIHKRQTNFYFRTRIPQDLQQHFPYLEIKRSLRTKDPKHAKILVKMWTSKAESVFMTLRTNILPPDQIQNYIQRELPSLWRKSKVPVISPSRRQRQEQQKKSKKLQQIIEEYIQEECLARRTSRRSDLLSRPSLPKFRTTRRTVRDAAKLLLPGRLADKVFEFRIDLGR